MPAHGNALGSWKLGRPHPHPHPIPTPTPAGYTILDALHNPFWEWLTNRMPMWLAPNLITLIGLVGIMLSYAASAICLPDFTGEEGEECLGSRPAQPPSWLAAPGKRATRSREGGGRTLPTAYGTHPSPPPAGTHTLPTCADSKNAPRWIHLANAVAIVVYTNLDCIDGKQVSDWRASAVTAGGGLAQTQQGSVVQHTAYVHGCLFDALLAPCPEASG